MGTHTVAAKDRGEVKLKPDGQILVQDRGGHHASYWMTKEEQRHIRDGLNENLGESERVNESYNAASVAAAKELAAMLPVKIPTVNSNRLLELVRIILAGCDPSPSSQDLLELLEGVVDHEAGNLLNDEWNETWGGIQSAIVDLKERLDANAKKLGEGRQEEDLAHGDLPQPANGHGLRASSDGWQAKEQNRIKRERDDLAAQVRDMRGMLWAIIQTFPQRAMMTAHIARAKNYLDFIRMHNARTKDQNEQFRDEGPDEE